MRQFFLRSYKLNYLRNMSNLLTDMFLMSNLLTDVKIWKKKFQLNNVSLHQRKLFKVKNFKIQNCQKYSVVHSLTWLQLSLNLTWCQPTIIKEIYQCTKIFTIGILKCYRPQLIYSNALCFETEQNLTIIMREFWLDFIFSVSIKHTALYLEIYFFSVS